MKKKLLFVLLLTVSIQLYASNTVLFKDSCNRVVEIPSNITKVVPSGSVASMVLSSIAPEYMCSSSSGFSKEQIRIIGNEVNKLPSTGNLYGGKSTINKEEILSTGAQLIVDIGTYRTGIENDLDKLQNQLGIPCVFLNSEIENLAETFKALGSILFHKELRGNEIASFIEKTLNIAYDCKQKIKNEEKVSVMICGNADGLGTNAEGSINAQVLEIIGAENAVKVKVPQNKAYGNILNLETIYNIDPDIILFADNSYFEKAGTDPAWKILSAIKNKKYYEIPNYPYDWISSPPSLNMVIGVYWLGNLLYPQYYSYDVSSKIKEAYKVLWNYEISQKELDTLLNYQY